MNNEISIYVNDRKYRKEDMYDLITDMNQPGFNFDKTSDDVMKKWDQYGFIRKDINDGEVLKVEDVLKANKSKFILECTMGTSVICNLKKEKKFFDTQGFSFDDLSSLSEWLNSSDSQEWFHNNNIYVTVFKENYEICGSLYQVYVDDMKEELLREVKNPQKTYNAHVLSKNNGGFIVDINGVLAFLPGSLAAANKIINFKEYLDKDIPVMIEDYLSDGDTFIVSNKKYIWNILPQKIKKLNFNDEYTGIITGTKKFGIFIEFEEIFTGLLHTSEMDDITLNKFYNKEYKAGDEITFKIKEIIKNNRIILTKRELINEKPIFQEFKDNCEGTIQKGKIVSIKDLGCFVEFRYNNNSFIGLYHNKEYKEDFVPEKGNILELYISKVLVEDRKIFLKNIKTKSK